MEHSPSFGAMNHLFRLSMIPVDAATKIQTAWRRNSQKARASQHSLVESSTKEILMGVYRARAALAIQEAFMKYRVKVYESRRLFILEWERTLSLDYSVFLELCPRVELDKVVRRIAAARQRLRQILVLRTNIEMFLHRHCLKVIAVTKIQAAWRAKSVRLSFDAARSWSGIVDGCPFANLSPLSSHRLRENLEIIFEGFPGLRHNYARKKKSYPPREAACNWGVNIYEEVMERHYNDLAKEVVERRTWELAHPGQDDGVCWLDDDFEPVQVYPPHHDDYVAVKRSVPRVNGEVAFDVTYANGPNKGYWQRVPLTYFMDFEELTFSHDSVTCAINDWVQTAKEFPKTKRNCICCNSRAEKGKVLCRGCMPKYQAIIEAE